ncbi:MAG: hypothetical protein CVU51_01060 [Deltaproteobacteria bacterium HGW-Deltaproteobacteria-1]|jgi:hypothetical protein|nr:MAG: hypothetical protein CVU51_01060 [Deltaproteobacteria bacterium HGW-Deltaproteobacteria-1]
MATIQEIFQATEGKQLMSFVNEVLSEKDKERFASYKIKSKLSSYGDLVPIPAKWTIDRDYDAILIRLEGWGMRRTGQGIPIFIALIWKDQLIRFEAFQEAGGNVEDGYEIWWEVTKVIIPKALEPETETILQLFSEALNVLGVAFAPAIVHINEIPSPIYVQEMQ